MINRLARTSPFAPRSLAAGLMMGVIWLLPGCESSGESRDLTFAYEHAADWTSVGSEPFREPFAIAVDPRNGHVIVTDVGSAQVMVVNREGQLIHRFGSYGDAPGQFRRPAGVAVGDDGSIYVSDFELSRVQKFTQTGRLAVDWGQSGVVTEHLEAPSGLTVDADGRLYVSDFVHHQVVVFDDNGGFIEALGHPGHDDAGKLYHPTDVALMADQSLLIVDTYNHRLQSWHASADGAPTEVWAVLALRKDQDPWNRHLRVPTGAAVDPKSPRLHVADSANYGLIALDLTGRVLGRWQLPEPGTQYSPTMVAVSPDGDRVYATDPPSGRVIVLRVR